MADVVLDRSSLPEPIRTEEPVTIRVSDVAGHILGHMRDEVWEQDVRRRPFFDPRTGQVSDLGGYRVGDAVGARGIERSLEDALRGTRGVVYERRDTGEQQRIEPVPGSDVHLSLDIQLQARVQAILTPEFGLARVQPWHHNDALALGRDLNGAAVVLDVETGQVLAMVSMPAVSGPDERPGDAPWRNRAVEAVYPPGSIIKPLILVAAVNERIHDLSTPITCAGSYFPDNPHAARCWIYRERWDFRTHASLLAEEALARSCNIFFYTLADRLGIERLDAWLGRFGIGTPLDCGLGSLQELEREGEARAVWVGESAGSLPGDAQIELMRAEGSLRFETTIMGIGQGAVTWTPLHAANAYATLARGGTIRDATLLLDDPRGTRRPRTADLELEPASVRAALEGLRQAVKEDHGTGHHIRYDDGSTERIINAPRVTARAKTGTAQAPPLDLDGDGELDPQTERNLDHSWFVGLVGAERDARPRYAIAVVIEYGGSGGRVAGPIANQIVRALQSEGYLPSEEGS
jgi:penicillin-binding protein 2